MGTNEALCQQVLDVDGEFSGALSPKASFVGGVDDAAEAIREEIGRLLHGKPLLITEGGGVRADAATLALRLQQLLAEREEAFWMERQQLSDRVMALERVRGGRTSKLLQHYDAAARGSGDQSKSGGGGIFKSGASAVTGSFRKLKA